MFFLSFLSLFFFFFFFFFDVFIICPAPKTAPGFRPFITVETVNSEVMIFLLSEIAKVIFELP